MTEPRDTSQAAERLQRLIDLNPGTILVGVEKDELRAVLAELQDALDRIDYVRHEVNGWNSRDQHLKTAVRKALGDPTWLGDGPMPDGKPRPKQSTPDAPSRVGEWQQADKEQA